MSIPDRIRHPELYQTHITNRDSLQKETNMTTIEYSGIAPEDVALINSPEFRAVLAAYPNLKVVTVEENYDSGELKEIFREMQLPLVDGIPDYIAVMDRDDEDAFMWVLHDDYATVEDPSPAFIEVLKLMDAFSLKTLDERLFQPANEDLYTDSPEVLAAEFNFTTGDYIL